MPSFQTKNIDRLKGTFDIWLEDTSIRVLDTIFEYRVDDDKNLTEFMIYIGLDDTSVYDTLVGPCMFKMKSSDVISYQLENYHPAIISRFEDSKLFVLKFEDLSQEVLDKIIYNIRSHIR